MKDIVALMQKAKGSSRALFMLNSLLWCGIPFNRPHRIKITSIDDLGVTAGIAYNKRNFNHIKGIHACAIATVGEYVAGWSLMQLFVPKDYRLIMSTLEVTYHYQAKRKCYARAELLADAVGGIQQQLTREDAVLHQMLSEVHDSENHHVASVLTTWQIKPWEKVKLKV